MVGVEILPDVSPKLETKSKSKTIRVLIVDDHQVVREGLRRMLETEKDIKVIGEAVNGEDAITKTTALNPDVVTMDLKMPGKDGISAVREIKQQHPSVDILMLTLYAEDFVKEAISAGASGYLLKDSDCEQIARAIRQVSDGLCPIAPSLTRSLVTQLSQVGKKSVSSLLTKRQRDVLKMIAEGIGCKEISTRLYVSPSTVKREIRKILAKLGVNDRAQAVSEGIKHGII
ncbi:MAG: response regulator transcription factor [Dehalococcoidales bacterium]|nr:response regulator transcription factor [Dehalococcoidales bacterium]